MVQSGAKWCKMEHNFRKATLWLKLGGDIKKGKLLKLTKHPLCLSQQHYSTHVGPPARVRSHCVYWFLSFLICI